jgi:hypothetical protein
MQTSFYDTMAIMYGDYFILHGEEKTFDFVFKTSIALGILNDLYIKFTSDKLNNVEPLEKIPQEKKEKYWNIACKYFPELKQRLQASKAIYTLELITSNF